MTGTIGIAGMGRMGTAFAKRLIEAGWAVKVWNRSPERLAQAVGAGAEAVDLAGLAGCDAILLSLTDGAASHQVVERLAAVGLTGGLVIEMSTILPDEAEQLAALVAAAGAEFVHCPVGGTVAPALKGQLLGMTGGRPEAIQRARPVLEALCRRVEEMGPPAAAARMKLAINLPLAVYWNTLGEGLRLLRGSGIDPELAVSLIADSSAGPTVLKNRAAVVVDTLRGQDQPGTFDLAGLAKDLRLAIEAVRAEDSGLELAEVALRGYEAFLDPKTAGCDGATLARLIAGRD